MNTPSEYQRITKSQLAAKYGTTWKTFKRRVWEILPSLKGNRRRILLPIEIQKIYREFGNPEQNLSDLD